MNRSPAVARRVEVLEARTLLAAGPASLVADVNAITLPSNPQYHVRLGDKLLFRAQHPVFGNEWFVTDGTAAGTSLLKDIRPGNASSLPFLRVPDSYFSQMAVVGDTLYFVADEGILAPQTGTELWKTDGTPEGTVRVKDILPGTRSSTPQYLTAVGNTLYFSATDTTSGTELWASDGTEQGTRRVADLQPGAGGSSPVPLAALDERLIFAARTAGAYELWSSDGTESGTTLLKDIHPTAGSNPGLPPDIGLGVSAEALVVAGEVYFAATDAAHGRELWKTDGTPGGTVRLTDLTGINTDPRHLVNVNGTVYFVDAPVVLNAAQKRVFRLDPTRPGGADQVGQIDWDNVHEAHLGAAGGKLFLVGPSQGRVAGVFTHDPASPAGTPLRFVKDVPFLSGFTAAGMIADVGGVAYFKVRPNDLWRSDGTDAGTRRVREVRPPSSADDTNAASAWRVVPGPGGAVYFTADDRLTGAELYRSDGTNPGTVRVADVNTNTYSGVTSGGVALPDGRVLFAGDDGMRGRELWVTDGTDAGTRLLKEVAPGEPGGVVPTRYGAGPETRLGVLFDGRVYFAGGASTTGTELWATDGTEAGTVMVKDLFPGNGSGSPDQFTVFRGRLYFRAGGGANGVPGDREVWSTDGTAGGTVVLKDINPAGESVPDELTVAGDTLYFSADDGSGRELWKTDGTAAGTVMVDLEAGRPSLPQHLTAWQGKLYFSATTVETGRELFVSDGGGARLVRDLYFFGYDSNPSKLAPASARLFLEAGPPGARDVYVTDGSADGTVLLRDRAAEAALGLRTVRLLGAGDGWAYFFNYYPGETQGTIVIELWRSDGTEGSTRKVATLPVVKAAIDTAAVLGTADGFLYFRMEGPGGAELWRTDGTAQGTLRVQDIRPGSTGSEPDHLVVAGGRLFFTANDGTHGTELWSMAMRPAERSDPGLVYGGSAFGGQVAPDKKPLRTGGTASAANVSGYQRGINQIVVALPGVLPAGVSAENFEFRVGRGGDPAAWAVAPAPLAVELLPWADGDPAVRYRITWPDGAIRNTWLRVTVKDSGRTGLAAADAFYFGNLVGETVGAGAPLAVNADDYAATRAALGRRAGVADPADHNRDGRVDTRDLVLVRRNYFQSLTPIQPAAASAAAPRRLVVRRAWEAVDAAPAGL